MLVVFEDDFAVIFKDDMRIVLMNWLDEVVSVKWWKVRFVISSTSY